MRRLLALFATGAALTTATGAPASASARADEPPTWHDADGPDAAAFPDPRPLRWRALAGTVDCLTSGALLRWPDDAPVDSTEP
jgi:hypothetical protein